MNYIKFFLSLILMLMLIVSSDIFADHHKRKKRRGRHLISTRNATYKKKCSECHEAYQPCLLPSGSWNRILSEIPDHFGEEFQIEEESLKIISIYLQKNATEFSYSKRSKKILGSLRGNLPLRITDIPYIKRKHHDLNTNVFNRKSIGSFSNCVACHPNSVQGDFDDDDVKIPK